MITLYFLPLAFTDTEAILPWLSNVTEALAPDPSPSISTKGTVLYPNPASMISIVSSSPSTKLACNLACLILTVPTFCRSISVSTATSNSCNISDGSSSLELRVERSIKSTKGCFERISLI